MYQFHLLLRIQILICVFFFFVPTGLENLDIAWNFVWSLENLENIYKIMFSRENEGRKGSGYIKNNMHEWNFYTFQLEDTYVPFVQLQNKRKK